MLSININKLLSLIPEGMQTYLFRILHSSKSRRDFGLFSNLAENYES